RARSTSRETRYRRVRRGSGRRARTVRRWVSPSRWPWRSSTPHAPTRSTRQSARQRLRASETFPAACHARGVPMALAVARAGAARRRAAIVHGCNDGAPSGPELADELRDALEGGTAIDPALAAAASLADDGDHGELGETQQCVPEDDHRVAFRLVDVAEQAA